MTTEVKAVVVDASVAAKWHLADEPHTAEADAILTAYDHGRLRLLAPAHIRYEVPSLFVRAARRQRLTPQQAEEAIAEFLELGLETVEDDKLILRGYAIALDPGCAFYDALYLALAERLRLPFVTADDRLLQRVGHLPYVRWIEGFSLP
ncbi:MAG: type II toxin-antitoxin system VapC family toxin [Armatimonadota bacterium]